MTKTITLTKGLSIETSGLSLNSQDVTDGALFLACRSFSPKNNNKGSHGIAYAGEAIKNGAVAIAWEPTNELHDMPISCIQEIEKDGQKFKKNVPLYRIKNLHEKVSSLAGQYYDNPSKDINIIGITGTNGKTSVSYFTAQALQGDKHQCGVIGTLGNGLLHDVEDTTQTTPNPIKVQELIYGMKQHQVSDIMMEVSSHALSQSRIQDINIDIAVFTNLSQDHLDYHGDMLSYAQAKRKLFDFDSLNAVIINADDKEGRKLLDYCHNKYSSQTNFKIISYSCETTNESRGEKLIASNVSYDQKGITFDLKLNDQSINQITTPLIGQFNLSNVLATAGVLIAMGYELKNIAHLLEKITPVVGRMQKINTQSSQQNALVIVDFAHTPDALEKSLSALKHHCQGQLWCVFGCGGDRDKGKRPLMAEKAEQYADQVIVTSDNPRNEEAMDIINDIRKGFKTSGYAVNEKREEAIKQAITRANTKDIILIAGKGHEEYQDIKGIKHPYSDIKISQSFLEEKTAA